MRVKPITTILCYFPILLFIRFMKKISNKAISVCMLGLIVISFPAIADNGEGPSDLEWLLYSELGAAAMSYWASEEPETYGGAMILASPLFAAFGESSKTTTEYGLGIAVFAGYGAYNISLKDEKKSTIFRNNFLLFNAVLLTAYFTKDSSSANALNESSTKTGIAFIPSGGLAYIVNHRI